MTNEITAACEISICRVGCCGFHTGSNGPGLRAGQVHCVSGQDTLLFLSPRECK